MMVLQFTLLTLLSNRFIMVGLHFLFYLLQEQPHCPSVGQTHCSSAFSQNEVVAVVEFKPRWNFFQSFPIISDSYFQNIIEKGCQLEIISLISEFWRSYQFVNFNVKSAKMCQFNVKNDNLTLLYGRKVNARYALVRVTLCVRYKLGTCKLLHKKFVSVFRVKPLNFFSFIRFVGEISSLKSFGRYILVLALESK